MVVKTNSKVVVALTILIVAICSGHAYQSIYSWVPWLTLPIIAITFFGCINRDTEKLWRIDQSQLAVLIFALMIACTTLVYFGSGLRYNLLLLCTIIAGHSLTQMYNFRKFARCYVICMTVVTAVAIVGYLLVQYTSYMHRLPLVKNANGIEYRMAGIFNYLAHVPDRNCAMFWEPGLFATHLTISMVFEIMLQKKPSFWRLVLFSVGFFTANSSAGFALWFLCMILLLVKNADIKRGLLAAYGGAIVLTLCVLVMLNFDYILLNTSLGENEYFGKLATDSVLESSRINAVDHNLKLFASAPFFGVGIVGAAANTAYVSDTSTFSYILSVFGLLGLSYTIYWVCGILKIPRINISAKIVLLVIAIIVLNKEPHHQLLTSWGILFYLIKGDWGEEKPIGDKKLAGQSSAGSFR